MSKHLLRLLLLLPITTFATSSFDEQVAELEKQMLWKPQEVIVVKLPEVKHWTKKTMTLPIQNIAEGDQKKIVKVPPFSLLNHLWFSENNSRISQGEHSHHTAKGWSMYAVDVAHSGPIVAPKYEVPYYTVAKVGKDKYLGDYVTLDFTGAFTLVYGHTKTKLKKGDTLKAGELIGYYSPTGMTTGPHTHIELWREGKNITFDMKLVNEKSLKLRVQRGRATYADGPEYIVQKVVEQSTLIKAARIFIAKFEGMHLKAYHDGSSRYSIGYGTISYAGEVITAEEANRRFEQALEKRAKVVQADFPKANVNQQAALLSMMYNVPSWYYDLLNNWVTEARWKSYRTFNKKVLKWLEIRRAAEWQLYNTPIN